ncbi:MAG: TetR/AcrR family transcriptional regulator [Kofleriaceae bacterium]
MATRPKAKRAPRREGERKRDATRRMLLDRALKLFQKRGVAATTMRDVARAAGLSLGAAYYHFPSKEALIFAYYEATQDAEEAIAATATGTTHERLAAILHGKLSSIEPQRKMLASIIQHLVDPGDPLSAFSAQTRAVRDRSIAVFARVVEHAGLPADVVPLAANALWMMSLAILLVFVNDDSPGQSRTHGLVDDVIEIITPVLPLLATPLGRGVAQRITAALARAQLVPGPRAG